MKREPARCWSLPWRSRWMRRRSCTARIRTCGSTRTRPVPQRRSLRSSPERGPGYIDTEKTRTVTTPATVRLPARQQLPRRDREARLQGRLDAARARVRLALWAVIVRPCEAVGALPSLRDEGQQPRRSSSLEARLSTSTRRNFIGGWGKGLRICSAPDALLGQHLQAEGEGQRLLERLARPRRAGDPPRPWRRPGRSPRPRAGVRQERPRRTAVPPPRKRPEHARRDAPPSLRAYAISAVAY